MWHCQALEEAEGRADCVLDAQIRAHHQAIVARPHVANRNADPQLAPTSLRRGSADESLADERKLELAHGALETKQQPIVWHRRIVNAVAVDDERADEPTELQ